MTVCEAVLTELDHLATKDGVPPSAVLRLVEAGDLTPIPQTGEAAQLRAWLDRYADAATDFADACVVRLTEFCKAAAVRTADRDVRSYRTRFDEPVQLLARFPV